MTRPCWLATTSSERASFPGLTAVCMINSVARKVLENYDRVCLGNTPSSEQSKPHGFDRVMTKNPLPGVKYCTGMLF